MAIFFSELSGSATSTGSFGSVNIDTSISESSPLTVDGTSGRLFTVTDQMSGSIFSANLISGLPVIEAFSDNKVNIGPFSSPIHIDGSGNLSGSSTSTGSFGHLRVAGEVSTQLKLRGSYTSTIKPYIRLQPNGSNSVLAFDGNNAPFFRSLSGIIFERRNDSSNQFYRYHAYFEYSTGRSYFGGSTMIHTNGSVFDAGDPKALLHVSGGNFFVEGGNISGSSTSTGSFGQIQLESEAGAGKKSAIFHNRFYIRASDTNPSVSSAYGGTAGNTFLGFEAGNQHVTNQPQTGHSNTMLGHYIGNSLTSGNYNTGVGAEVNIATLTGDGNTSIGSQAGRNLTSGNNNTILGKSSGYNLTTTAETVLIGAYAGTAINSADSNRTVAIGHQALRVMTSGGQNTVVGGQSGFDLTTADYVTLLGYRSGYNITTGGHNTAVGYYAMLYNVDGTGNTAVGSQAMSGISGNSHSDNTAIGYSALKDITTGGSNVAVGKDAGKVISTGNNNTILGKSSGLSLTTGYENVLIGSNAARTTTGLQHAVVIGMNAGYNITTNAEGVVIIGNEAGLALTTGRYNLAIGMNALRSVTTSNYNVAVGEDAGREHTGAYSTFVGYQAGRYPKTDFNTAVGWQALYKIGNTTGGGNGEQNVAIGAGAMAGGDDTVANNNGYMNVAVGNYSLGGATRSTDGSAFTANRNVAIGHNAGYNASTAFGNVLVGTYAGQALTTSQANTFVGYGAGTALTTAELGSTAIGYQAYSSTTVYGRGVAIGYHAMKDLNRTDQSDYTVAIGYRAAYTATDGILRSVFIGGSSGQNANGNYKVHVGFYSGFNSGDGTAQTYLGYWAGAQASGSNNTFVGHETGKGGGSAITGGSNTAVGYQALMGFTTGYQNVAMGYQAALNTTTGQNNIAIGTQALQNNTTSHGNIAIGYRTLYNAVNASSYQIAIGDGALFNHSGSADDYALAIGFEAGYNSQTDIGAVMIGYRAGYRSSGYSGIYMGSQAGLYSTNSGIYIGRNAGQGVENYSGGNVAIGYLSGTSFMSTSDNNVFVGMQAGRYATGSSNTFIGEQAGLGGTTSAPYSSGQYNVALGAEALAGFTTGGANVAIGYQAGNDITTGANNVFIGNLAGDLVTTGTNNVVVGSGALGSADGLERENIAVGFGAAGGMNSDSAIRNVFIGEYAGYGGTGNLQYSVAIGYRALDSTGTANVAGAIAIGYEALTAANNSNVDYSIAIGYTALNTLQSGQHNIGIGFQALTATNGGQFNIALGSEAGKFTVNGSNNIYIGYQAARGVSGESQNYNTVIGYQSAYSIDGADHTVTLGYQAGYNLRDGDKNVIIGSGAGYNLKDTFENVAIGYQALYTLESLGGDGYDFGQSRSTAVGAYALHLAEDRDEVYAGNTAVGHSAGYRGGSNLQFGGNVYVGNNAGYWHDGGSSVFIGQSAGYNYMSGSYNVAIGRDAMRGYATSSATGTDNVVIGDQAGYYWKSSFNSVVVGNNAGYQGAGSRDNTLVGNNAGYNMSGSQQYNTYIGSAAGYGKNLASNNVAVGISALGGTDWKDLSSVNGDWSANTAVGAYAGRYAANGFSTFFGYEAGSRAAGSSNNFIGYYAGRGITSSAPYTNGGNNIAIGREALESFRSGSYNIALGRDAMTSQQDSTDNVAMGYHALSGAGSATNNTTSHNVAIGRQAMYFHGQGDYNIAIGRAALYDDVSGSLNVAIGREAGSNNVTGTSNVFIGYQSAFGSHGNSPSYNTALGFRSLYSISTGIYNVALGYDSGKNITTGPRNTLIGSSAGDTITTGEQNILIGHGADVSTGAGSNRIGIGYNVSVDADNKTIIGVPNTDITTILGRVALHSVSSDYATFSHYDRANGTEYAIRQAADGATAINTTTSANRISFNINNSTKMVLKGDDVGIGTTTPDQKLDVEGNDSAGTFIQIRDTGDDYPVGVTYNHGASGHHYSWYAGTMDGTSGERKFTISAGVINGFNNTLTDGTLSILTLNQINRSTTLTGDLNVSSSVAFTHSGDKKLKFGSNVNDGGVKVTSAVMTVGDIEGSDAIQEVTATVFGGNKYLKVTEDGVGIDKTATHPLDVSGTTRTDNIIVTNAITPVSTLVLQSSAANSGQDVNDASRDIYWATMSTENTTHVDWTAGSNGYYIRFVTAGEYMVYVDLIVTDATANDRMNFFGWVSHMNSSNSIYYSYPLGGAYIRDDSSLYDSGGVGGNARLIVAANDRVKVNTQRFDSQDSTDDNPLDTTLSRIRIEKITYGTTA